MVPNHTVLKGAEAMIEPMAQPVAMPSAPTAGLRLDPSRRHECEWFTSAIVTRRPSGVNSRPLKDRQPHAGEDDG
jgi:hypothetical protein